MHGESARVVSRSGRFKAFTVNRHGSEVLVHCSGTERLSGIIQTLIQTDDADPGKENILRFVRQMDRLGVLDYLEEPGEQIGVITGSSERITPQVVSIELTERCNFHCRYCYQNATSTGSGFLENPIEMLTFFHQLNVAGFELTGGEPLLHPRFEEIVDFIMANFEMVGLITNGSLLRERHLDRLAAGPCMAAVQICLDGHTPELVEATTGVMGSLEMEVNAIRRVKDFGIILRVGMVVDAPEKIDAMEETLLLARDLGADSFIAHPAIDFGRGAEAVRSFSLEDHQRLNEKIFQLQEKYRGFFAREMESGEIDFQTLGNCGGGHRAVTVDWRGRVKPCPMIRAESLQLGHWRDVEMDAYQKKAWAYHLLQGPKKDVCGDCRYFAYCFNCIARAFRAMHIVGDCKWRKKNQELLQVIQDRSA